MRKYLAALTLLVLPAALLAQGGRGGRGFGARGGNPVEVVLQHRSDLNLTADQVSKLEAVASKLEENNKPLIAELQKQRPDRQRRQELTEQQREQMRGVLEKLRDNREEAQKAVASILTDAQKEKVRSFRPERAERGQRPGGRGFAGFAQRNPVQMILQHRSELSLAADQVSKLESIARTLEQQNQPIIAKLQQARQPGVRPQDLTEAQRTELRSSMEKVRDNTQAAMENAKAVLSKEQQEKLKSLRPAGHKGDEGTRRAGARSR